ncbi:MAG: hypothetical protein CL698_09985 [Chloroflexi bacterium]|nr:hypothetical protein [Chloroflexota bacterium]MBE43289.1 hypothetical protein [Chloroflexota bacterium]MQG01325.1 hypothetical protein [SAR202 cluster bacterium]|tara:strand:+ start:295 stop:558 length:264 start_codon:yes stop_codon:yes gene_type:complete
MKGIEIKSANVNVELDYFLQGSVIKGTVNNSVTEVRSYFEVDSEETEEKVKEVIKLAKQGCFAESLVRNAIPLVSTCLLNGNEISVP